MIEVEPDEVRAFIELALDRMMAKARAVRDRVTERPDIEGSNSVYGLVVHCIGVADWWLDHVVLGNPSTRDRDAEFAATGTIDELDALVVAFRSRLPGLLEEVAATLKPASAHVAAATAGERAWPWSTASIVLHVVDELFQHAGHADITADLLAGVEPVRHQVVAAVLVRGDEVLLCHRHPARRWYPNAWDLPGGHVDSGEARMTALVRELREELGIDIDPIDATSVLHHSPKPDLDIEVWAIERWSGDVTNAAPDEHDELRWFAAGELDSIELADPGVAVACRRAVAHVAGT